MALQPYTIMFRAQDTALTLNESSFSLFVKQSDGSAPTNPAPANFRNDGFGVYTFFYDPREEVIFVVDGGADIPSASDRFVRGVMSPVDSMLDATVSSRAQASELTALRADYTQARAQRLDNLDAAVSATATSAEVQAFQTTMDEILDYQEGKWEILLTGPWANHMVIYRRNGTVLKRFALFGAGGEPTYLNPFVRDPVTEPR